MSDSHKKALATVPTSDVPERVHPLVALATNPDVDPEKLAALVALQRDYEAAEAKRLFDVAMSEMMSDDDWPMVIGRDKRVHFESRRTQTVTSYTHTSLAMAVRTVLPLLTRYGFTHHWEVHNDKAGVHVTTVVDHKGGHNRKTTLTAPPDTSGTKNGGQSVASTATLLSRHGLLLLLGLATDDMADPQPTEPDPEGVDQRQNQRALAWLIRQGWTAERCAEVLGGKPREQWTRADLRTLREAYEANDDPTGPTDGDPPLGGELGDGAAEPEAEAL